MKTLQRFSLIIGTIPLFLLSVIIVAPAKTEAAIPNQVVGARLNLYSKPSDSKCNLKVPSNYSSIQAAVNAANPGDTICVGPGVYNEDVVITKSVKLYGNGFDNKLGPSVINGQSPFGAIQINANDVSINGFEINASAAAGPTNAALLLGESSSNALIKSNVINASNGSRTLRADGGQQSHRIQNNILSGFNSPFIASVSGASLNPLKPSDAVDFIGNTFRGTSQMALETAATNSLVNLNDFKSSADSGILIVYDYGSGSGNVNSNNFNTSAHTKLYVSVGTLIAKNNWWGDTDPSDNVVHDVDYSPFRTQPYPTVIPTVKVGHQVWMKFNLDSGQMVTGSTPQTNNSLLEKHCYNDDPNNCLAYGGLYQWDEMMQYTTRQSSRGICPGGFHLPSDGEWKALEISLGMDPTAANNEGNRGTDQGAKMLLTGSTGLDFPISGYSGGGSFYGINFRTWIWTSSQSVTPGMESWAWLRAPQWGQIERDLEHKNVGLPVRCVKNI